MASTSKKKKQLDTDMYSKIVREHSILWDILEIAKKEYNFPVDSVLEIGSGTGNYLTDFLIKKERAGEIEKFYAIEPVDEFFERSKRSVVRLSRTDATAHEYFGGNPFDIITFSFVYNHIHPDKKKTFLNNVYSNLRDEESRLVVIESFIPEYEEGKKSEAEEKHMQAHKDYADLTDNSYIARYLKKVEKGDYDDLLIGPYKSTLKEFVGYLDQVGFDEITVQKFTGKSKSDWDTLGYHVITAVKE
ncbi:class I SAM-dependent methyltransferase [Candidatus Dojkabacteria bacterium]|uniref:Class I SAM-dependent methyltransferase n=1 Tax=Candidatus Dojkabacteria bacterium TaxID=2099670 RepID=A0A955L852_9BACT|nr:class I SAM-dependent methyltransferase [Candidatus Dojkabacteria bacterium]